jgi:hypothetical protein
MDAETSRGLRISGVIALLRRGDEVITRLS